MEDMATPTPVDEVTTATTVPTPVPAPETEEEYPAMTMEDVLQAEEVHKLREVNRGDVVKGTVVFIGAEGIAVDVGAKVEGIIPLNQISEDPITQEQAQELYKPGDEIDAFVVRTDPANGVIVLSKKRADQDKGWRVLQEMQETNGTFSVDILEKVRGGLVAQVEGIRAFLPASQVETAASTNSTPTWASRSTSSSSNSTVSATGSSSRTAPSWKKRKLRLEKKPCRPSRRERCSRVKWSKSPTSACS